MDEPPFLVPAIVNHEHVVDAQVDSGCSCFAAVSERWVQKAGLTQIPLPTPRNLGTAVGAPRANHITHIVRFTIDMDSWHTAVVAYVVPGATRSLLLGLPWLRHHKVVMDAAADRLVVGAARGQVILESRARSVVQPSRSISGPAAGAWLRRKARDRSADITVVGTSLREMTKILSATALRAAPVEGDKGALAASLPEEIRDFTPLFDKAEASGLAPHRGRFDHHIRLKPRADGSPPDLPWGPLYDMSRDQLLELRKQVTDLCDKGWVRASSSPAAAPVLLVRKASGGWRFCVDYRALNQITELDRYPLPLVRETLRSLAGAQWFTKLDVRAAFHRIRIAEGQEHLTAFRTRFGLFEWLVTPFGLTGAPATFQRYINSVLGDILEDFVTAYLDDVLVFSSGSRRDHMKKVREVLRRLQAAGLNLDRDKCEFAVKQVKYLGFIVEVGMGVRTDPEKVAAVRDWAAPRSVRGVRSFLGFANFYRDFIERFSELVEPLLRLTAKGAPFHWGPEAASSFEALKEAFIEAPVLAHWDPNLDAVVEADCSKFAMGGCLSVRKGGVLHPVAYFSARLSPAQRNYPIHDKELLAVVQALKAWAAMLQSVARPFTILTDHKALEYFMTPRRLSERQARWAEALSPFRYHIRYRPGRQAQRPDALSRREQDGVDADGDDNIDQVVVPVSVAVTDVAVPAPQGSTLFEDESLQRLWDEGVAADPLYRIRCDALRAGLRRFPKEAGTTAQIADCALSAHGALQFRGRLWMPCYEPLTTSILQRVHDSPVVGHPGREVTFQVLARDYHWDDMSQAVRRFCRNCDVCRRINPSRRLRQGLLKPIPAPDRYWTQISVDFMTDLPARGGGPRFLMVVTDRLSKWVLLEAMDSMSAEACAKRFVSSWWRHHGFPLSVISDRGSDWTGAFWTSLCNQVGMTQKLSTAFHPETDGATERMNQEVQKYLRHTITFLQDDWPEHLPACQMAINNRDSSVTGLSPNRLVNGFDVRAVPGPLDMTASAASPKGRAAAFLDHLRTGMELAQAAIDFTQQQQEAVANRRRRPAEAFHVGDRVWLSLRHIRTNRPMKKLDWLYQKYTVLEVPTPQTVTLDVPGRIHPTFNVDLVERAASDPLPSQSSTDERPGPVLVANDADGTAEEEYVIEEIQDVRNSPGRPRRGVHPREVLVKWKGWDQATWEPLANYADTAALARFEARWGDAATCERPSRSRRTRGGPRMA